ncbi:VOC family protein [Pseudonocardia asaccharolytica]|uniref:VOC family protein n=1 Tax=Pseudonocardia asaccharolytica DSM 44247 = NBRC 16224 TaxID=1123024 RepID=A0A511CY60_9PSEU|nr:VOC family protein [Pseudonocardia asaccharolytica]GEL17397.1 VOC family protein [Pseudonocardia asaccharolytica DSM 44247 = NBRC 16224]
MGSVSTCLWFDGQAEEAARFYTSVVKNSRITGVVPYGDAGPGPKGSVMIVTFELDGQRFLGLNGGPEFTFDEAISVHLTCDSQEEIDELWARLTADGGAEGPCGWLKDKYGLSWQIDSRVLHEMLVSDDQEAAARATRAMLGMRKLDIQALREAYDGTA